MLPCFDQSYRVHLIKQDKKLHNKKILYQPLPICHQKMNHLVVEVLIRIEQSFLHLLIYTINYFFTLDDRSLVE